MTAENIGLSTDIVMENFEAVQNIVDPIQLAQGATPKHILLRNTNSPFIKIVTSNMDTPYAVWDIFLIFLQPCAAWLR